MKIVLVNMPWKKNGCWGVRAGSRWPHLRDRTEINYLPFPFYLAYAASLLKKNGFAVTLIDAIAEQMSYNAFNQRINNLRPDLLIVETSTVTLLHDLKLLRGLKGCGAIALCGPDVNIRQPSFLKEHEFIDYVMFGEYEATALELSRALSGQFRPADIKGLIHRDKGRVIQNATRPLIPELDSLPWPLREQLPLKRYNDSPGDIPVPCASMWASRGCPYRCSFCLWPQVMYSGSIYRVRDPADVVKEMEYLVRKLGFRSIYFDDDTWNVGRERMLSFCDELEKSELRVPWAIMARAELMDEELLERMRAAGLFSVKYGIESSNQQLLNNIEKGSDLKKAEEVIKYTKYLGIRTHLTFTFGLPGETEETARHSIDYACRLNPTSVQFSLATPFPGTRFYEQMKRDGFIVSKNWGDFDGNYRSVIRTAALEANQLVQIRQFALKEWDRHCLNRRKNPDVPQITLRSKTVAVFREKGIWATTLKILCYIIRRLIILPVRLRRSAAGKMLLVEESIGHENLKVVFSEGRVRLFWKNKEFTKDVGLNTSLHSGPCWYDSSQANWKLEKESADSIVVRLKWDAIPLRQIWNLKIGPDGILNWQSRMLVEKEREVLEYKAGIMLPDKYRLWQDGLGTGRFPPVRGWEEIELYNPDSVSLKVRTDVSNGLPEIEMFRNAGHPDTVFPQLQNSDKKLGARLMQMRRLRLDRFPPGEYLCFDLSLRINDALAGQSLDEYRRPVPLRFFKEQLAGKGLLRILKYLRPSRIKEYYSDILGVLDGSRAFGGPRFAQIDLTNDCNNDCVACWCNSPLLGDKKIPENVKNQYLPYDLVIQTIEELHSLGTKEIYFAGGGEPFMHPDILAIISRVKELGLGCYINTNFTLVNEDIIKRLADLKVDHLIVSVWAGTPRTYYLTHPNKSEEMFGQIKGMLKLLNSLKQDKPRVNIYNVISNLNCRELEQMVDFAQETGSDSLEFTVVDTIPNATDVLMLNKQEREIVVESCRRIQKRLETELKDKIQVLQFEQFIRRVRSDSAGNAEYDKEVLEEMPCYVGWIFTRILADGNVNFCLKAHRVPVGNIYAHTFSRIWNGRRQREYRRRALCAPRNDPFFSLIGNDPDSTNGCFKGCDDLARNIRMHKKMQSLSRPEFYVLRLVLLWKKIFLRLRGEGKEDRAAALRERETKHSSLKKNKTSLEFQGDGVRIFRDGEELTRSVGMASSLCVYGLWYDSSRARWQIVQAGKNELVLSNEWDGLPVSQEWRLTLNDERVVDWKISLKVDERVDIEADKVSLMLPSTYAEWRSGSQSGRFPIFTGWKQMRLRETGDKRVSVSGAGRRFPGLTLDFESSREFVPEIQNSDRSLSARVISAKREYGPDKVMGPGLYPFFQGRIVIDE